jgi:hypothetical protein
MLPEPTQTTVLVLLARMIARSVIDEEGVAVGDDRG